MGESVIWISYTTKYRGGGSMLERTAKTLAASKSHAATVICTAVESKQDFLDALQDIQAEGQKIREMHFVGHAGMYGPMFGTISWPEQFSPHEWRAMRIPFAEDGLAFFHCCRSARWFAPFFARTFRVPAHGYSWYTTFSTSLDHFVWPHRLTPASAPIYMFGCQGRKSHGLLGSLRKYSGRTKPESFRRFDPPNKDVDASYDPVAKLYNQAYSDIRVRKDEWSWLSKRITSSGQERVLDIGCGNGALLKLLAPAIKEGTGLDLSAGMLSHARANNAAHAHISFAQVRGPQLPCEDNSVDAVISMLSFRYLDWDPILAEIRRVLAPGGRIYIIDMVASPPAWNEVPTMLKQKVKERLRTGANQSFRQNLVHLVADERWKNMLDYNPIRSEHEMRWYLESRFPSAHIDILNIGMHARILAFDSGPIEKASDLPTHIS